MMKIDLKKGNASGYIGLALVILSYVGIICIVALFGMFYAHNRTQIITDVVADGATVAGNLPSGFNAEIMESKAVEILEKNNVENVEISDIKVAPEINAEGNPTGSILVSTTLESEIELYVPLYLDYGSRFHSSATAIVRVDPITNEEGLLGDNFIHLGTQIPPFVTSLPGKRNGAYVSWFMNFYLNPEQNLIYDKSVNSFFIYDYLICMGFTHEEINCDNGTLNQKLQSFFAGDEWKEVHKREEIINIANSGKPVVIITDESIPQYSVVMPVQGVIGADEIPTAFVGEKRWNYKNINMDEFESAKILYHE